MNDKISILYDLSEDNNELSVELREVLLESNIALSGISFKLYILIDNDLSADTQLKYRRKYNAELIIKSVSKTKSFNEFLKIINTRHAVYLPINIHLDNNWLADLYYFSTTIQLSGVVSICSQNKKGFHQPLLQIDNQLQDVYICEFISGLFIIDFTLINAIGGLDQQFTTLNAALINYCQRSKIKGFNNFNLPIQNAICNEQLPPTAPDEKIDNVFIPLFNRDANQLRAFKFLENLKLFLLENNACIFENQSTANFGLELDFLTPANIKTINEFSASYNLTFIISSSQKNRIKVVMLNN